MIRKYSKEDIPFIVELEMDTLGTTLGQDMLLQELKNPLAYYYVYLEKNELIAYISLSFDGYLGEILNFAVSKKYQKKGIGTKLICHALDELYSLGAESFILEVRESNQNAISLYKKIGFKQISIRKKYYSNGENALVLQKNMVLWKDMEEVYTTSFSKKIVHEGYTEFIDDQLKSKYFHNFYSISDQSVMESLFHREGFVQFELFEPYTGALKFHEHETHVIYHANIYSIHPLKQKNYDCRKLDSIDKDIFYGVLYMDSLSIGEEYSKDNAKRHSDVAFVDKKIDWYFVYSGGMPVGFLSVCKYQDFAKIEDFCVNEEFQHLGFGSTLFSYTLEELKKEGIKDIILAADMEDTPKEMYERMGFTKVGTRYIYREVFE